MGIWIRSQDKKNLQIVNSIALQNTSKSKENTDNPFDYEYDGTRIRAIDPYDNILLGTYSTEERAIGVLDEIHTRINTNPNTVYLMPEE